MTFLRRYFILLVITLLIIATIIFQNPANAIHAETLTHSQQQFIKTLKQSVKQVNDEVLAKRKRVSKDYQTWQDQHSISDSEKSWLNDLASDLKMETFSVNANVDWQELMHRVDVVPESLAIAQAIDESAWGHSRYAVKANNLFGRYCYKRGCGIMPLHSGKKSKRQVKKFETRLASVRDYVHNINSHEAYEKFRFMRASLREQNKPLDGIILANGLKLYSTRGQGYVNDIKSIINRFEL